MRNHKHTGVARSNGNLRSHPINRTHKDLDVKKEHNKSLITSQKMYLQTWKGQVLKPSTTKKKTSVKEKIKNVKQLFGKKKETEDGLKNLMDNGSEGDKRMVHVDEDGYMSINLDDSDCKGLRLTLTRTEREGSKDHKKTVGIQFENNPARSGKTTGKKLIVDEQY